MLKTSRAEELAKLVRLHARQGAISKSKALAELVERAETNEQESTRLDWLIRSHVIGPEVKIGFQSHMNGDREALVIVDGREFKSFDSIRDAMDKAIRQARAKEGE